MPVLESDDVSSAWVRNPQNVFVPVRRPAAAPIEVALAPRDPGVPVRPRTVSKPSGPPKTAGPKGGGGGGVDPNAEANAARSRAGNRYLEQAANLEAQAKALKYALDVSLKKGLDQNLADAGVILEDQLRLYKEGFAKRYSMFQGTRDDVAIGSDMERSQGISNLVRERQDTMTNLLEHGAGETDALKAMVLSARNWQANATESNKSYFDSMRSLNAAVTDLNVDTKTSMSNASAQYESEADRLWNEYYNRRSETWTAYGNVRGQQRDYYAQAKEMKVKPKKGQEETAKKEAENAFMSSAKELGNSYVNKGVRKDIKDWQGGELFEAKQTNTNLAAANKYQAPAKAEGAALRKWG